MKHTEYSAMAQALFDILFENDKLGEFELPFPHYFFGIDDKPEIPVVAKLKQQGPVIARVNVVFKKNWHEDNFRMPVIVIEKNGKYQDFYYNPSDGVWKLLSENYEHMTFQDWWDEEQVAMPRAKVPNFLFATESVGSGKIFEGSEFEQIEINY